MEWFEIEVGSEVDCWAEGGIWSVGSEGVSFVEDWADGGLGGEWSVDVFGEVVDEGSGEGL